ncbi:LysR family transcriptional regulator [Martelella soudanensis]|uniref:LysR family transcriptional regulator n=1 Tax=unclassified Martelella TaxID=2629616 RepID=UPI0035304974
MRLNMSQPAVSHALARLRLLFDDPLLIRRGGQLVPSATGTRRGAGHRLFQGAKIRPGSGSAGCLQLLCRIRD